MQAIVILGLTGSGKTTVANILKQQHDFQVLEYSQPMRQFADSIGITDAWHSPPSDRTRKFLVGLGNLIEDAVPGALWDLMMREAKGDNPVAVVGLRQMTGFCRAMVDHAKFWECVGRGCASSADLVSDLEVVLSQLQNHPHVTINTKGDIASLSGKVAAALESHDV